MTEVTTSEIFNCSVDEFYKILVDYESYPEFVNEISKCIILETDGNKQLVEYEVKIVKAFTYKLWMIKEAPNKISWEVADDNIFKLNSGFWKLEPTDNKCKATYHLKYQLKVFVPNLIEKTLAEVNLPNVMSSCHKRVRDLYEEQTQRKRHKQ